jgi:hypothetical protein
MAIITLGALSTLNLLTHLDAMFVELYQTRSLMTVSGVNIGLGKTPSVKWDVAGVIQADATNSSATFGSGGEFFTTNNGSLTGSSGYGFKIGGTVGAAILAMGGGTAGSASIAIGTGVAGAVQERARFTSTGFVLGNVAAVATLDVNGTACVRNGTGVSAYMEFAGNGQGVGTSSLAVGQDGVGNGVVYQRHTLDLYFATSSQERLRILAAGSIAAGGDNTQTFGTAAKRWSTIFAGTSTINTSDAREKTEVGALTPNELAAASALAREIGTFKFLAAVQEKGEDTARSHIGMTVQRAMEIMRAHELEPSAYAFICHDAWDAEGDQPAGDRYGFRMDQLLAFVAAGMEARMTAIEARLAALEEFDA